MILSSKTGVFSCFVVLLALQGCGRKQRAIFSFEENKTPKINRLVFPAARGINAVAQADGVHVSWENITGTFEYNAQLLGYNIYKVTDRRFIRKKPLNRHPIVGTSFHDRKKRHGNRGYLVRGVFSAKGATVVGPASALATVIF